MESDVGGESRRGVDKTVARLMDFFKVRRVEKLVDIEQNKEIVIGSGKAFDESSPSCADGVRCWLNLIERDSHDTRDGVNGAAHGATADIHHDCPGLGIVFPAGKFEERAKIDDRDDGAAEVAHAVDVRRNLGNSSDARWDDDFLNAFDPKDVLLVS